MRLEIMLDSGRIGAEGITQLGKRTELLVTQTAC